jgi:hypothetical protein
MPHPTSRADSLTQTHTAFESFQAMLNAKGYRPTLRPDIHPDLAELADLYDQAQAQRGDSRRAFRG